MNNFIYFDEVTEYLKQGYFEMFAPNNGPLIGLYHPGYEHYMKVEQRETYVEAYHPAMTVCQGSFPTPDGEIFYTTYPEYIEKIESAFRKALQGWHA